MSKSENPRFVFFLFLHSKRVAAAFSLPRARCLPSPCCCLRRTRGAFQLAIAFFFLSARFATSLTFFVLSPRLFSSSARFPGPAEPFHGLQRVARALQQRPRRSTPHRFSAASSSWSSPRFDAKPPLNVGVAARSKFQEPRGGQAVVSSQRNCDIKEQETGVGLATKLLQIVRSQLRPQRAKNSILRLWISRDERHFALRFGGGSISMGRRYQLTNSSHRARGESSSLFALLRTRHSSTLLPNSSLNEPRITPPSLPHLRGSPHGFRVATSLSLPRHSDILRHNVENQRTQGSFSFSFLTPNESRRLSPCRERVVYPLLVDVCRGFGNTPARHCFFSSLCA